MSILIDKNTKVITQGITGKTGQFHTRMCRDYANGKNCFVAGVNPKKAGESFEGIPIHASGKDAKAATGATVSVIYVQQDEGQGGRWRQEDAAARPQLPRPDHAGRNQDRHHAGPHPPQGPHRRRQPLGHADL